MNFLNTLFTKPFNKVPEKIQHFLEPTKDGELERLVKENSNYANYNIMQQDLNSRVVLTSLRDIPSMLQDAVCSAALACLMNTAFQTTTDNKVFEVQSAVKSVENELKDFHRSIDAENLILTIGYNLAIWGQLPFRHCFSEDGVLERVIPIPDFTKVTPIILSGKTVGFMVDGVFHPSYEYTYAQVNYYKDLGGNRMGNYLTLGAGLMGEVEEFKNEFTYVNSYLGTASKPWRNIAATEDALLLNRMDQSNYYRIISVLVGGQVYSKAAIQALNYYRNLFKKVRRVSYDASGMASKGSGQNFEVIVPKTQNQGVEIQNVGGEVDVRALKDLDVQYNRLFSALQIQPSMIGFSQDMPSSLGESTATLWDKRFAKVCKVYSHSAFEALRNIDYLHLRSKGFDVQKDDWKYSTVSATIQDDKEKGEVLQTSIDNYTKIVESFQKSNVEYDKAYLTKTLLGGSLASLGVDPDKLLNPKGQQSEKTLTSNFKKIILDEDAKIMSYCGVFKKQEAKELLSALVEKDTEIKVDERVSPITLKELCSSVAVNKKSYLNLEGFVEKLDATREEITASFTPKNSRVEKMMSSKFTWPIYTSRGIEVTVEDMSKAHIGAVSHLYIDEMGRKYILSKADLVTYLNSYINESLDVYCEIVTTKEK